MIILRTRSEVKVTMTLKCYETLCYLNMHPHQKFGLPTSNNIGDMHWRGSRTDGLKDVQTDGEMASAITIRLSKFLWGHKKTVFLKNLST